MTAIPPTRQKLVCVGWWRPGTGLTRVAAETLSRLAEHWDIHYAGVGYAGPVKQINGWTLHPTDFQTRDAFGAHRAAELVQEHRPSAVIAFNDLWFLNGYRVAIERTGVKPRLIAYLPLDGELHDSNLAQPLLGYDDVVVYTQWARRQVETAIGELTTQKSPNVEVAGHGVDLQAFRPSKELVAADYHYSGRAAAKRQVFKALPSPEKSFVVLNASRPSPRKCIGITVDGFAQWLQNIPATDRDHCYLCLHQAITSDEHTQPIVDQIAQLGLQRNVLMQPFQSGPVSDQDLNLLYNACDVGINSSNGEGWGLVSFEHAAAGGRQIVPDHSACGELWTEHGIRLPVHRKAVEPYSPLRLSHVSAQSVSNALMKSFQRRHGSGLAEQRLWCQRPQFKWESVAASWHRLLANGDDLLSCNKKRATQ